MTVQPQGPSTTAAQRAQALERVDVAALEQEIIAAEVAAGFALLWATFDPGSQSTEFLAGLASLVSEWGDASLQIAQLHLNDQRAILGLPPIPAAEYGRALDAQLRDRSQADLIVTNARFEVLRRVDRRRPVTASARLAAFSAGEGRAIQRSLAPGRQLVTDLAGQKFLADDGEAGALVLDREIVGWYRRTDGDPCAFCAMLASRGAIYRTRFTAGVRVNENANLDGSYNASFHPSCRCVAVPLYSTELDVPELNLELRELWEQTRRELSAAGEATDPTAMRRAYRRAIEKRSARLASADSVSNDQPSRTDASGS